MTHQLPTVGEPADGQIVMSAQGLAVSFIKQVNSWTHTLEQTAAEPAIEIVRAFESDPARDQPGRVVSPVFQEVHRHDPDGAVGLLLTGNWFQHHFSAAVSLSLGTAPDAMVLLDVDVADRCRAMVEILAATYVVPLDSGALLDATPAKIVWRVDGPRAGQLELVALGSASLALAESGRAAARVQVVAALEPGAFTHRLRYQWRWASR